jgi:hypothetical protein
MIGRDRSWLRFSVSPLRRFAATLYRHPSRRDGTLRGPDWAWQALADVPPAQLYAWACDLPEWWVDAGVMMV